MIKFTINQGNKEKEYRLAFDRESVKYAEKKKGFHFDDFGTLPVTAYSTLFNVAFYKHHGIMSEAATDEIFASLANKSGVIQKLVEEYADVLSAFISDDEDENSNEKKVQWEIV